MSLLVNKVWSASPQIPHFGSNPTRVFIGCCLSECLTLAAWRRCRAPRVDKHEATAAEEDLPEGHLRQFVCHQSSSSSSCRRVQTLDVFSSPGVQSLCLALIGQLFISQRLKQRSFFSSRIVSVTLRLPSLCRGQPKPAKCRFSYPRCIRKSGRLCNPEK